HANLRLWSNPRLSGTIERVSRASSSASRGSISIRRGTLMDLGVHTLVSNEATSAQAHPAVSLSAAAPLRGSVLVLIQYDVCEEIRLDELRKIFPARKAEASFKKAPAYVRY